jgi:S-adenosylmethionine:tRNA ribosyltransferase-isomerase
MVVDRENSKLFHSRFSQIEDFLTARDLCVLNNSRVFPARLYGNPEGRDRQVEVLLLREVEEDLWEALVRPGKRVRPGSRLIFKSNEFEAQVEEAPGPGKRLLRFDYSGCLSDWIQLMGHIPLPPYIKRTDGRLRQFDEERYQTVYAKEARSVAAPTAGLHFTQNLLKRIRHCEITLHVGYGTFKPISTASVENHEMEAEQYSVGETAARLIREYMEPDHRVISVGTTAARTLEHVYLTKGQMTEDSGFTDLYIYPGFEFSVIKGLLTNFHLPGSTLLVMVAAFAGRDLIRHAYDEAVRRRYRFYSYGDAMLILS